MGDWSRQAIGQCEHIARQHPDADPKTLRKVLSEAYPWGPRENWPYRTWCAAVRKVLAARAARLSFLLVGDRPCDHRGCMFKGDPYDVVLTGMLVATVRVCRCPKHATDPKHTLTRVETTP